MKYDKKELENTKVYIPEDKNYKKFKITFDSPISPRENFRRMMDGDPEWIPLRSDEAWFCPEIIPDNVARAFIIQGPKFEGNVGGKDMFGIDWEYVPTAKGSIVRPGNPTLTDISKWKDTIIFPDIDTWDWEGSAEKNVDFLTNNEKYLNVCIFTGWFERLISFMDFGPAAYALMNKEQKPYVKELFEKITDLWIDLIDHFDKYYKHQFDGFCFHDDWGAQHAPFFSEKVVREMLVPYMKRVTDHCHELGYKAELHSCGKLLKLITCIEDAGWDAWQGMDINDYHDAYANLTTKLIMTVNCDEDLKNKTDAELTEIAKRFVDEYGSKSHPVMLGNRFPAAPVYFLKEIYRLSREKLGE